MNDSKKIKTNTLQLKRYAVAIVLAWTLVISASLIWNIHFENKEALESVRIQAQSAYAKDIVYRSWNAVHGGVYVPMTEETQPNPYLSDIPERDIITPSGKMLTLINPAYMMRQVHELEKKEYGISGHLTSLNPINPNNAPDGWEAEALQAFEQGETEISSVEEIKSEAYMRLMRPLIVERGCLKCHAKQGYKEGDIRGGLSISISMAPLMTISQAHIFWVTLGHAFIWLMGMGGIAFGMIRLNKSERNRGRFEEALGERIHHFR